MRQISFFVLLISLALTFAGCGGGGGGGGAAVNPNDAVLASKIVGTWKLIKETDDLGVLKTVNANSSGKVNTVTFNADNTATTIAYSMQTTDQLAFWTTDDVAPETSAGSWVISNESLVVTSQHGTFSYPITIVDNILTQTNSDNEKMVYEKVP